VTHTTVQHPQAAALEVLQGAIDRVTTTQHDAIRAAATLGATALSGDGILQAFGTGHSKAFAMELTGRAGGLIPTNQLSLKDLVMFGGVAPGEILDPTVERDPSLAARVLALHDVRPEDVFLIASNSGINGSVVEMARLARGRGNPVVAVTSLQHSRSTPSRHPSGERLCDVADVVIDNCGVPGDAGLRLTGGGAIVSTSTVTSSLVAQLVTAEICAQLLALGATPPVFRSANMPGGDEHNAALLARYAGRICVQEP
jgi:uncharacterized phosphosugar-binding protein